MNTIILNGMSDEKKINLCFACNDNYAPHMATAIVSIIKNVSANRQIDIFVLISSFSEKNRQKIEKLKKIRNFNISYISVTVDEFSDCPITGYVSYITKETYYRFKIPELLKDIDKVLYLDCDIIALTDISPLFDYELPVGKLLGMIPDTANDYHIKRLKFNDSTHYCNAGVILLNNKELRKIGATKLLFDYTAKPDRDITFQDQDIINIVFKENIEYLPISWNVMQDALLDNDAYTEDLMVEWQNAIRNPRIIHYTNPTKPWNYGCVNPYKKAYLRKLKETPFFSTKLKVSIFNILKFLVSFIYSKEQKDRYTRIKRIFGIKIKKTDKNKKLFDTITKEITNNLNHKLWWIHECVKSIFQYNTGLEFDDEYRPERMIVFDYNKAPKDHKERYDFASKIISESDIVLDAACGVGYGTSHLASTCKSAIGLDINLHAISFAKKIFSSHNLKFEVADILELNPSLYPQFDTIVSFETIEHVSNANILLKSFRNILKKHGKLICSVPNQNKVPFSKVTHPFHVRHFTLDELTTILKENGFGNFKIYFQYEKSKFEIREQKQNDEGEDIIVVAEAL